MSDQPVVVVTGAQGSIGAAVCAHFKSEGYVVVGIDRLPGTGGVSSLDDYFVCDVASLAEIQSVIPAILQRYAAIDVLVNAAGVTSSGRFETVSEPEWDRVVDINMKATFFLCQAVLPVMVARGQGSIVNIGSLIGRNGGNARSWINPQEIEQASNVVYAASKAGVHAITIALAKEVAHTGVRINAVAPGPIQTPMTRNFPESLRAQIPVGQMGTPEGVAFAVSFLADPRNTFVTGEILDMNGGMLCD